MAGGDLRIRNDQVPGLGQDHAIEVIDASSVKSGDFTEARHVQGGQVFLTPDGAAAFDQLSQDRFQFFVQSDPKGFWGWLMGDRTGPKGEQFQGKADVP